MKLKQKLYVCTDGADYRSLVRALTRASAMNYIAEKSITIEIAGPDQIVELTKAGVEVEDAKATEVNATEELSFASVAEPAPEKPKRKR